MKNTQNHSVLQIVKRTFRENRKTFLCISSIFLITNLFFVWNLNIMQRENAQIKDVVNQLEKDNLNEQNSVFKMCLATTGKDKKEYQNLSFYYDMEIQDRIKVLRKTMPEQKEQYKQIQDILQSALKVRHLAILNSSAKEDSERALEILEVDYAPKMQKIAYICKKLSEQVTERSKRRMMQAIVLSIVSFIITAVVTIWSIYVSKKREKDVYHMLREPIREIVKAMQQMEQGNLIHHINYCEYNEMGFLAVCIKDTMSILRGHIKNINDVLKSLSKKQYNISLQHEYNGDFMQIGDSLNVITEELNQTVKEITDSSDAVTEMIQHVNIIADNLAGDTVKNVASIQELSALMEEIVFQVRGNLNHIEQVSVEEKKMTNHVDSCQETMGNLQTVMEKTVESSEHLEEFMKSMDAISQQIKVLSLNATIEASHSGELGKGFSVVAAEICKLSEQIVNITKKSKEYIYKCNSQIHRGEELVEYTNGEIIQISREFHRILQMVQNVADVSEQQLKEIEHFEVNITEMATVVQEDSQLAGKLKEGAKDMECAANKISIKMNEFQIREQSLSIS